MPQPSKKDLIAQAALPLLLELGIKGTSIDKVVKASGVSKPTVYKHFPDKAALVYHAIWLWLSAQPQPIIRAQALSGLQIELGESWLAQTPLSIYALMLGEAQRVPETVQLFLNSYDKPWREAIRAWPETVGRNNPDIDFQASHWLFERLTQVAETT